MCAPNCEELQDPKLHNACVEFNPQPPLLGRGVEATGHGISGGISGARLGHDSAVSGMTGGVLRNPLLSGTSIPGPALLNHL